MSDLSATVRSLSRYIADDRSEQLELRWGTVAAVGTGTVDVYLGGSTDIVPAVKHLASYTPTVGNQIAILKSGPDLLVIGRI